MSSTNGGGSNGGPASGKRPPSDSGAAGKKLARTEDSAVAMRKTTAELARLRKLPPNEQPFEVDVLDEREALRWDVRVSKLDEELDRSVKNAGASALTLGVRFPARYPFEPPFVWVKSPRLYGSHVMSNGSICAEVLMTSGWTPATTITALVASVTALIARAKECPTTKLADGSLAENSETEARASFGTVENIHSEWSHPTAASSARQSTRAMRS